MNENESYIYGLLITDGNLSLTERNRGKVTLEVNVKDKDIIEKLAQEIPNSSTGQRTRDTNFKENYQSVFFRNSQLDFRNFLIENGFPTEEKTLLAAPPTTAYDKIGFWRGVIDGDGSLGFIASGMPFVSLVTKSEPLKQAYCDFLKENFEIEKRINRNKRDKIFNITIKGEEAVSLAKLLYLDSSSNLFLNRKKEKAIEMSTWVRTGRKVVRKNWTKEEDDYILTHSLAESEEHLNRTVSSIKSRLYRLK